MRVSVVIPAYNEEKYIENTILSVKRQKHNDIEIIVVDNSSTDRTAEKVRNFPGVVLLMEKRRGVQYARECGRLYAKGDFIANLDSDCLPREDWIVNALEYFEDGEVVAVSGPYYYHDGGLIFRTLSHLTQKFFYTFFHYLGHNIFHRGVIVLGGNVIIRAETLENIGGYNTSIEFYGDDTDTANRLLPHGKVLFKNNMTILSSARRFKEQGFLRVFYLYIINFFWIIFFKVPFHRGSMGQIFSKKMQ